MSEGESVFLRALGAEAQRLRPEVREYVAGPPAGTTLGRGRGVFVVAGSPYRKLAGMLRLVAGPDVALSDYERDVPFEIANRPVDDGGRCRLDAERIFGFRRGAQRFVDTLQMGMPEGTLVNTPGVDGRLQLLLECSVTDDGDFKMRSRGARIRVGSGFIHLPRLLSVQAEVVDGWDAVRQRRTVAVTVRNPLLGVVLRYEGWFDYQYE